MPDLQGIPYSDPIRVFILVYEDFRFAIICRMATAFLPSQRPSHSMSGLAYNVRFMLSTFEGKI